MCVKGFYGSHLSNLSLLSNELIQLSKPDVVDRFVQAVNRLAERLKQAQQAT
jgi:hypothetical protein